MGHVARAGKRVGTYRILVVKPDGKRQLVKPRHRWEIILKFILKNLNGVIDWIDLVDNRDGWRAFLNMLMNHRTP